MDRGVPRTIRLAGIAGCRDTGRREGDALRTPQRKRIDAAHPIGTLQPGPSRTHAAQSANQRILPAPADTLGGVVPQFDTVIACRIDIIAALADDPVGAYSP